MKVLMATYWAIPHLGGVWPYITEVSNRLRALGHEVDIMGNHTDGMHYHRNHTQLFNYGHALPMLNRKLSMERQPHLYQHPWIELYEKNRYSMELALAYFGLEKYDVIHAQDVLALAALRRVKPKQTPLIGSIHGSLAKEGYALLDRTTGYTPEQVASVKKYLVALERYGADSADTVITSSNWLKQILVNERGIPTEHVTVFPYGFDIPAFLEKMAQPTDMEHPVGKSVILYTGRLYHMKGIHHLLNALAMLKRVRSDWVCWLAGDGEASEKAKLEQQARQLGISEDVKFLGRRSDVPSLLRLADIYALPTLIDNQPFSLMEAQVAGKAVVVSDAAGIPEMVEHGHTGLVHPVGHEEAMANHFRWLLEDPAMRQRFGENARQWGYTQWSIELMVDRLVAVFQSQLANNR